MSDTLNALREQLQQLEARHARGDLPQDEYGAQRAALERAILDQVIARPAPAGAAAAEAAARPSTRLVAGLAAVVLAIAAGGYAWTGSPALLGGAPPAAPVAGDEVQQFTAAVERLSARLASEPDNAEGWGVLARAYVHLERFDDSLPAFVKAIALSPTDARLLADYADAMAVTRGRKLEGEPTALLERALKIDPDNLKALALAGTAAFDRQDFAGALRHWERLQQVAPPDSPFMGQLRESIAEARKAGGLPPAGATPPPAAAAGGATITGTLRLAPSLKASPEDTVFVFARPAEGSRMPLAILRRQVRDLPLQFTLDDSLAMSPAARLSSHPKVVIEARISRSGQAEPQAGDLFARTGPVPNDTRGLVVEIADVVK
jgi:cytochrome c-type biogenesis protein CcmH